MVSLSRFLLCAALLCVPIMPAQRARAESAPSPAESVASTTLPAVYHEAPVLSQRVMEGKLPPVAERLPLKPVVVVPLEEIGRYGGTWHRMMKGPADIHTFTRITYENLLRWPSDLKDGIIPNLVEKWEFNDAYTTLTLHVREGLKWSDGAPFTADDVSFWWQYIAKDDNISSIESYWKPGGKPMKLTQLDPLTIRLEFAVPYPLSLEYLSFKAGQWPLGFDRYGMFAPKHYLAPYHPKCQVERPAGLVPSYREFEEKANDINPDRPVMTAWRICRWEPGQSLWATRNPYYWKVDPAGNQLPYIDEVIHEVFYNPELVNFRALSGGIDMQMRHFRTEDLDLLRDFSKQRHFHVILFRTTNMSGVAFNLEYRGENFDAPPESEDAERAAVLRSYFQDIRFRRGMALAVNRELIRNLIFKGTPDPPTYGYSKYSRLYFDDSPYREYLQYDPARANALLDEAGLDKRDADGFRVMKDGRTMSLILETYAAETVLNSLEIVRSNWESVGVKTTIKPLERTLGHIRIEQNGQHMAGQSDADAVFPILTQDQRFCVKPSGAWGHFYAQWYKSKGAKGIEPPPDIRRCQKTYDEMQIAVDPNKTAELARELTALHAENVWYIPTRGADLYIGMVRDNVGNVPTDGFGAWTVYTPGNKNPHTFFFKGAE